MRSLALVLLVTLLGACSAPPVRDFARRQAVLEEALGEIGRPYQYGGADADGFDCSGLVHYVYAQSGVELPRTAAEQRRAGRAIGFDHLAAGDLAIFDFDGLLHATIYVGDGKVVHAPARGQTVIVTRVDNPYWRERLVAARRILD